MFHRIPINKAVIHITSEELNSLLLQNISLYREILIRSKNLERSRNLKARIEHKKGVEGF